MSEDIFFEVKLEFEKKSSDRDIIEAYVLNNILHGLRKLYGEAGASVPIDIVQFHAKKGKATRVILSCPKHFGPQLRAGITLQGSYQGEVCAYHVEKTSLEPLEIDSSIAKQVRYC